MIFYKNIFDKFFENGHNKNVQFYIFHINIKNIYEKIQFLKNIIYMVIIIIIINKKCLTMTFFKENLNKIKRFRCFFVSHLY